MHTSTFTLMCRSNKNRRNICCSKVFPLRRRKGREGNELDWSMYVLVFTLFRENGIIVVAYNSLFLQPLRYCCLKSTNVLYSKSVLHNGLCWLLVLLLVVLLLRIQNWISSHIKLIFHVCVVSYVHPHYFLVCIARS